MLLLCARGTAILNLNADSAEFFQKLKRFFEPKYEFKAFLEKNPSVKVKNVAIIFHIVHIIAYLKRFMYE